jgi:hypothetical protein
MPHDLQTTDSAMHAAWSASGLVLGGIALDLA